ncbi:MAG: hypothetical protein Tsb0020_23140 [Haliangiales bacterium]
MIFRSPLLIAAAIALIGACADDPDDPGSNAPDAAPIGGSEDAAPDDASPTPDASLADAGTQPDASAACVASAALPSTYAPNDIVSSGEVTVVDGVTRIDATAGGFLNVQENPFIYLAFAGDALQKVEITDVESFDDQGWDFAIKRTGWRVNGGDSGVGGVEVAAVTATSLDEVTDAPAQDQYSTSEWLTDDCQYSGSGLLDEPGPAFADWYDYNPETNIVSPKADVVFVVRRADGAQFKLKILTYRRDDISGQYEVEWATL